MAKNYWRVYREPFITWLADLGNAAGDAEGLLAWRRAVLAAGAAHEVYLPDASPSDRAQPDLAADVESRYRSSGVLDLFHTETVEPVRAAARMAYADLDGAVVERIVDDLGALLSRCAPTRWRRLRR